MKSDLKKTRQRLVAKDNRLIQESRYALGLIEMKALIYIISKIKPTDEPGKIYIFDCQEFLELLNWNKDSSYQNIKGLLQRLGDASFWISDTTNGRRKEILVRWIIIVRLDLGDGSIEIGFHPDMFPFLLDLKKDVERGNYYTTYKLQNVALMKHRYSIRLYELLKSYQYNNKKWTFENGTGSVYDLQIKLADTYQDKKSRKAVSHVPKGWSNWAVFKRNVLDPAVKEINKYTDIKVAYDGKKFDIHHQKTRAVRTIEFYMVKKTGPEQRDTDRCIDEEYMSADHELPVITVEEKFFNEHEKSLLKEQREQDAVREMELEEIIDASKYPVLFSALNKQRNAGFSEKKVNELYNIAIRGRVAGKIPSMDWELFAENIITHYYDKIVATPEKTKKTLYSRLRNEILKDYDEMAEIFAEQYENSST